MESAINSLFFLAILIFSVVIHEVSHGLMALLLGDPTAKHAGRLTLNPLPHLDPVGSILVPLLLLVSRSPFLVGWARPVPYNPYNLSNQKWGPALVGAAGPGSNLFVAIVFGVIGMLMPISTAAKSQLVQRFLIALSSGSNPLSVNASGLEAFYVISLLVILLNIVLAVFNLIPIPPLDGSKVLFSILPYQWRSVQYFLEQYGFFLIILFIVFFAGAVVGPIAFALFRIVAVFTLL